MKHAAQRGYRWGILNHLGGIWSPENFATEEEAVAYLEQQRAEWRAKGWGDLSKHRVATLKLMLTIPKGDHHAR